MKKWHAIQMRTEMDDPASGYTFLSFDTSDISLNYVVMALDQTSQQQVRFTTLRQWEARGSRQRGGTAVTEGNRPEPDDEEESPPENGEDAEEDSGEETESDGEEPPAEEAPRSARRTRTRN